MRERTYRPMRGRPSKQDAALLRARIEEVALDEFRRNGFAGASIDGVARAAMVSRTTIYALFTDKETLFADLLIRAIRVNDISTCVIFDDRPAAIVLVEALNALNAFYHRKPNRELLRICMAEADRFPDLFDRARDGFVSGLAGLMNYFGRMQLCGRMIETDPTCAALLFNMLALGTLRPFMVTCDRIDPAEAGMHLPLALRLFVRGAFNDPAAEGG